MAFSFKQFLITLQQDMEPIEVAALSEVEQVGLGALAGLVAALVAKLSPPPAATTGSTAA